MSTLALPSFSGRIDDSFAVYFAKLHAWFRIHDVPSSAGSPSSSSSSPTSFTFHGPTGPTSKGPNDDPRFSHDNTNTSSFQASSTAVIYPKTNSDPPGSVAVRAAAGSMSYTGPTTVQSGGGCPSHGQGILHTVQEAVVAQNNSDPEQEARKLDILLLSLEPGSLAERWYLQQPHARRKDYQSAIRLLEGRFGGRASMELARQSARNVLASRGFRDNAHIGETVKAFVDDFEVLALQADWSEAEALEGLIWCFKAYGAASRLLQKSRNLQEAYLALLRWEKILVERLGGGSAGVAGGPLPPSKI